MFHEAKDVLECPRNCDVACQGCLLTYDTQHHLDDLNRKCALRLLDETFLNALALPTALQVFGPKTRLEMEPLALALRRELQRQAMREIRVFLGGHAEAWEPLDWRLLDELVRLRGAGVTLCLIMPQNKLAQLTPSQSDELAVLTAVSGAEVYLPETTPQTEEAAHRLPIVLALAMTATPSVGLPVKKMPWRQHPAGAMAKAAPSLYACIVTTLYLRSRSPGFIKPPQNCALCRVPSSRFPSPKN